MIWDLGYEGWGSWKNVKYIRGGRYLPPFRHEGFTGHPDEIVGVTSHLTQEQLQDIVEYMKAL